MPSHCGEDDDEVPPISKFLVQTLDGSGEEEEGETRSSDHLQREAETDLADCRTDGRTDEANSLSLLVVAAQCEIRSGADRRRSPPSLPSSNFVLLAHSAQIRFALLPLPPLLPPRVCFSNSNRFGRASSVLVRSSVHRARCERTSVQKMRRPSATRKALRSFVISLQGLALQDLIVIGDATARGN